MAGDSVQPEIAEVNSQAEAAGSDTPVGDLSDCVNEYLNMCDHMVYGLLPVACLYWHLRFKEKKVFTVY